MVLTQNPVTSSSTRLADVVYERLCDAIVDGMLSPGQRVRDGELANDLGVSRMPVREALQRLERQGLVEMVASRFTRIAEVSPELSAQSLEFLLNQLATGLRLAIGRMDDDQRARTAELVRGVAAQADDPVAAYGAVTAFGDHLAERSGNAVYAAAVDDSRLRVTRNLRGKLPLVTSAAQLRTTCEQVAALIESGDADGAERLVRDSFIFDAAAVPSVFAELWPRED